MLLLVVWVVFAVLFVYYLLIRFVFSVYNVGVYCSGITAWLRFCGVLLGMGWLLLVCLRFVWRELRVVLRANCHCGVGCVRMGRSFCDSLPYVCWFIVNSVVLLASLFWFFVACVVLWCCCVGCLELFLGLVLVVGVWGLCRILLIAFDCG